jgi:hypothetical protein
MIPLFFLSVIAPFVAALMMFRWAFSEVGNGRSSDLLCATLALGVGLGLGSCTFFLWRVTGVTQTAFQIMETSFFLLLGGTFFLLQRRESTSPVTDATILSDDDLSKRGRLLRIGFCVVLTVAIIAFVTLTISEPHGSWDAVAIWNLSARFLFSSQQWKDGFSPLIAHPDYPLLIPATVARFWAYLGFETVLVPALVAGFFTFGTVILITSAFSVIEQRDHGLLAGLFLLGTGFFIKHGSAQYADVPLGFFALSTILILALSDRMSPTNSRLAAMAGIMASMAAWTKNEGFLFIVAVVVARSVLFVYPRRFRQYFKELFFFSLGLAPVMVIVALFKLNYAPSNDLVSHQSFNGIVLHLSDFSRYTYIAKTFAKKMMYFGNGLVGLLLIYVFLSKFEIDRMSRPTIITAGSILVIMLVGHFLVYIVSPYELKWHLSTSLERLLLQLWPVFLFFLFFVSKPLYAKRQTEK